MDVKLLRTSHDNESYPVEGQLRANRSKRQRDVCVCVSLIFFWDLNIKIRGKLTFQREGIYFILRDCKVGICRCSRSKGEMQHTGVYNLPLTLYLVFRSLTQFLPLSLSLIFLLLAALHTDWNTTTYTFPHSVPPREPPNKPKLTFKLTWAVRDEWTCFLYSIIFLILLYMVVMLF